MSSHPVLPDAVRPGRPDGTCFYCSVPVGGEHDARCVLRTKKVRVLVTIEMEREYPECWDDGMIEFHGNRGSWCASNIVEELVALDREESCLCGRFSLKVAPKEEA